MSLAANDECSAAASTSAPAKLVTRRLESTDFHKGFLELLAQLTTVGSQSQAQFDERLAEIDANAARHSVMVIEDVGRARVIACATLYIEPKFVRSCGTIGHIEDGAQAFFIMSTRSSLDQEFPPSHCLRLSLSLFSSSVVVASGYRGQQLGITIVDTLKDLAKQRGCYKVILNCSDKNVSFYQKLGFSRKENQMAVYF